MQVSVRNLPPTPSGKRIALRVTPSAERALRRGHPWLFADAITRQSHEGQPGDLAVIFDRNRNFIAIGLYEPTSSISFNQSALVCTKAF
jgi:23S rRNA (cytosine1962-C5)-methyltransferase